MLADILKDAFARSRRRVGFILVDILWKAVWFVCGVGAVVLVAAWFGSGLRDLAWEDTGTRTLNALIAVEALREFWSAMKGEIVLSLSVAIGAVTAAWFALEAFVRSRIFSGQRGVMHDENRSVIDRAYRVRSGTVGALDERPLPS